MLDIGSASVRQIIPLAGAPVGGIAAASLGGKRPWAMFVATADGGIAGFDENGSTLPGWPVAATASNEAGAMPALGDLDGDGASELLTIRSNGAAVPDFGLISVWSVRNGMARRLWSHDHAAWQMCDEPLPANVKSTATLGHRTVLNRRVEGRQACAARKASGGDRQ